MPKPIIHTGWMDRPFIEYVSEVDRLLEQQFGITTADTDLEMAAAAQEAGETPQEHVDWLSEHYHLEPLPQSNRRTL